MQQQQPLAFTLIKTVVTARDEGRRLSVPLQTAWELLRAELSPAHRVISDEVAWGPEHQNDLKFVIDGLRTQFEKDPSLEKEVLTFLAEVEPFEETNRGEAALPLLLTTSVAGNTSLTLLDEADLLSENGETPNDTSISAEEETANVEFDHSIDLEINTEPVKASNTENSTLSDEVDYTHEQVGLDHENEVKDVLKQDTTSPLSHKSAFDEQDNSPTTQPNFIAWGSLLVILSVLGLAYILWPKDNLPETEVPVNAEDADSLADSIQYPSNTIQAGAANLPEASKTRKPYKSPSIESLAQDVDSLLTNGYYAEGLQKQAQLVQDLATSESSSEKQAEALSLLAQLYVSQNNPLQAVVEQRKALEHTYKAFGESSVQAGRAHLTLGVYYSHTDELHMSNAHLRQAKLIFGQHQDLIKPSDLDRAAALNEEILSKS